MEKLREIYNIIKEVNTYSEKQLRCFYKYANNSNEVIKCYASVNLL